MIFVTVGHQMPFDRLIRAVDAWAVKNDRDDVFAQVGSTQFRPARIQWVDKLAPAEFRQRMLLADAVVSHAGMGTILTALELGRPIVVMPRVARLAETRNDHQVATAIRFRELGRVSVALDETEIPSVLDRLGELLVGGTISSEATPMLINAVRSFVFERDSDACNPGDPSLQIEH